MAEGSNHKHQVPNKYQIPRGKPYVRLPPALFVDLRFRSLEIVWSLRFGAWSFAASVMARLIGEAVRPEAMPGEVNEYIFERGLSVRHQREVGGKGIDDLAHELMPPSPL